VAAAMACPSKDFNRRYAIISEEMQVCIISYEIFCLYIATLVLLHPSFRRDSWRPPGPRSLSVSETTWTSGFRRLT
jgi:hypothetical protein